MQTTELPAHIDESVSSWDKALYAYLAEKERRSGSMRTVQSYSRMLTHFFGSLSKSPDRIVSPEVLAWAHGVGLSGRKPSAVTVGARIACLSSFYRFLIRMGAIPSNPCDALERPRTGQSQARGYGGDDVKKLLAVIPNTIPGRRDRAMILTLVLTGRRRAEVVNLKAGDLTIEGDTAFYTYRGKGGKRGRRELPAPAFAAIKVTLADCGKDLSAMKPDGVALAGRHRRERDHQRHALLALSQVPHRGRALPDRTARPAPHGCQAPARCWGVGRGGVAVPRPLLARGHHGVSAAARRQPGRELGQGSGGDWGVRPLLARPSV